MEHIFQGDSSGLRVPPLRPRESRSDPRLEGVLATKPGWMLSSIIGAEVAQ